MLVAPTHPLRALWFAGWAKLGALWVDAAQTANREYVVPTRDALLRILTPTNFPPVLPTEAGQVLTAIDSINPFWTLFAPSNEEDPRGLVGEVCSALGLPEPAIGGALIDGAYLASRVRRYLVQHPYVRTLTINAFNPGRAAVIGEMLLDLQKDPVFAQLRYDIRLFVPDTDAPGVGEEIAALLRADGGTAAREADAFSTPAVNHLFPKLRVAVRSTDDFRVAPDIHGAHLSILFDVFPAEEVGARRTPPQRTSAFVHGLVQDFSTEYYEDELTIAWRRLPRHGQAEPIVGSEELSDLLGSLSAAISSATATISSGESGLDLRPVVGLALSTEDRTLLHQVHEVSDWVFTIDRNLGIEFFDHGGRANRPDYLIDHSPDMANALGHRLVITSRSLAELEALLRPVLEQFGLSAEGRRAVILLDQLRALSGRLALKLISSPNQRAEALGLALSRLYLEHQGVFTNQIIVPLDTHLDLYRALKEQADELGDEVSFRRTDLALFDLDVARRSITCRLVEVKCYAGVGDLGVYNALKTTIAEQIAQSEKVLAHHFDPSRTVHDRPDRALKTRELASLLEFYLARAERHGAIVQVAAAEARDFLGTLGDEYLPADKKTRAFGKGHGVVGDPNDYGSYRQWLDEMSSTLGNDYPKLSHSAHVWFEDQALEDEPDEPEGTPVPHGRRFWVAAPGRKAKHWQDFHEQGIIAIGWPELLDLRKYETKEAVRQRLQELHPGSARTNDALTCWDFAHTIKLGDVLIVKQGLSRIVGYGIVRGDYEFDASRNEYPHLHRVEWLGKGDWQLPEDRLPQKTLTDITPDRDLVDRIVHLVGLDLSSGALAVDLDSSLPHTGISHWWLNANPKMWNFEETAVGERQTYTSHNERGNKRQKYKYFQHVKPGDLLVGYVTSPQREIVGICRITKGLHETPNGEEIEFEKVERLNKPVLYETLQANPDLENCEPIVNHQGSLFRLTEQEYEIIRSLIDEANPAETAAPKPYTKQMAMDGLFMPEVQFDQSIDALLERKNLVLQGAPGVGKTFVAERIAKALIGSDDPQRIEMIQFHQSYSYEDFVQGFRPTAKGTFDLKYGIFHQFCRRAQRDEASGQRYVFIIDEINRGNLSKIFGELMMLIEPDKRGKKWAIPLAYASDSDDRFYVPENLYLIGMMNTADRSLAMVDYALRRRFRFISLQPEFSSIAFQGYLELKGVDASLVNRIVAKMNALNATIAADTKNLGAGYQIGHSYFCPANGLAANESWYRRVVEFEIVPLIREYWLDDEKKVEELRAALLS